MDKHKRHSKFTSGVQWHFQQLYSLVMLSGSLIAVRHPNSVDSQERSRCRHRRSSVAAISLHAANLCGVVGAFTGAAEGGR